MPKARVGKRQWMPLYWKRRKARQNARLAKRIGNKLVALGVTPTAAGTFGADLSDLVLSGEDLRTQLYRFLQTPHHDRDELSWIAAYMETEVGHMRYHALSASRLLKKTPLVP